MGETQPSLIGSRWAAIAIVATNLLLACATYETAGWHDIRGYREVTNGIFVIPILAIAAINGVASRATFTRKHRLVGRRRSTVSSAFFVCAIAMLISIPIAPWIGRFLKYHLVIYTPLIEAARYQDESLVIKKLQLGDDPNSRHKVLSHAVLHYMAATGKANAVEVLLKKGANPNVQDAGGQAPLHWAVFSAADLKTIQLLVKHGANPKLRDSQGRTPISMANGMPEPKCSAILAILGTTPIRGM
jgi:hypothetical protein